MAGYLKDPEANLDYQLDWSPWLEDNEIITTSTFIATTGLTVASSSHTATTATVWLSGGTVGTSYTVTNEIITSGGRIDDRSFTVRVEQR
jgi:hypothetical protein